MKRNKRIPVLLGVLAAVSVITLCVTNYEEKQEKIRTSGQTIMAIPSDTVQSISWSYGETELSFHKDENWVYDGDAAFPVDEEKINALLETFTDMDAAFAIEEAEDTSVYGLDEPVCTISLTASDTVWQVELGDFSTLDSQRYLTIGDGNVYLVSKDPMDAFEKELSDFILNDTVPEIYRAQTITFTGAEDYALYYDAESTVSICADDVYYTQRSGSVLPLETGNVTAFVSAVEGLSPGEYATYNATAEELASFGLDNPDLTAVIDYSNENGDEGSFCFSLGRNVEEAKASLEDDTLPVTCYIRIGDSQIVYTITQSKYDTLMASTYNDMRHDELMTADFADVSSIDITLDGAVYTITTEKSEDNDTVKYLYNETELEEQQLSALRTAVRSMRADSFTEEKAADKTEISVVYHLNNEEHPTIQITLYRYDGTNCLAAVDGRSTALVQRSAVVDLIEAVNAIILG